MFANDSLHAVYNESIDDNVKLFMDNYELRMKENCPEKDENSDDPPANGFMRV